MNEKGKLHEGLLPSDNDLDMDSGTSATISYNDGFEVKFLPSLEVLMKKSSKSLSSEDEVSRIVTKTGSVIRNFKNGDK